MKKVIIIGAGPAGITAGYELLKQSNEYEVTILEETPYIGGISRTEVYNGHRMDIGGHRFFSKSQEVNDWWEKIMPMQGAPAYDDDKLGRDVPLVKGGPDPEKTDRVMLNRSRVSHIYYNRKFFEYPVKMNMNTFKNMGFGTTMQAGFSYLGSMVAKKPESSLENFYINQFGKKLYSMFFEGYTEKLWGRHPREIDPSWGAQRTKGLSITEIVKDATRKVFHKENKEVNTSLIEAFKYPKLGPGQLWEAAAADFEAMGGSIHTNCRVIRINTNGNMVESVTCAVDGITIEEKADIVISSMPIKDLIMGMTNVPPNVTEVARKLPYRDFVTVGLLVPKLRINNTTYVKTLGNVIPDTWIYVQDTGVKMGRIQIFNNWSPYLLENPEKTVWVGLEYFCNEGDRYWNMTDEEWVQFATKELIQMGILSESAKILDSHKVAVKKAYPAYFDTYSRFEEIRTYLDGYDNLYCVGRNGQHRYNNMDHSMITSFEAVKNILGGVKDKSNIWNVNTEKEYHEEKIIKKESTENSVKKAEDVIATQSESSVVEEKPAVTATPVPPVKQVQEKEEELKAMVQEVPAPPVRKQIRRNSKVEQVVAEEKVISSDTVEEVVSKETDAESVKEQMVIETETVVPEAEIHVSKSRSIWDDVAIAEAEAPVKTAPIVVKPAVMEEAIEKTVTEVKEEVLPAESKAESVAETDAIKEETVAEVTNAAEEKKPKRTRRKKAEVAEEKVEEKDSSNAEVTSEEKPVVETEQGAEVEKKTTRGRKKKAIPAVEVKEEKIAVTVEEVKEESVAEVVEEIKEEPVAEVIEEVKEESVTENVEENKEEPVTEVEEKIKEEPVVEAVKEIKEDSEPETKKPKRTKRKVKEEKKEEVAEKKAEEAVKTDETAKEEKTVSRSASGKTIAGRTASHRASSNRKVSSRTKAEASEKKVSNIGKEAVVGNMKGTVIKANVIQKTPEDEKKSSNGRSGRR